MTLFEYVQGAQVFFPKQSCQYPIFILLLMNVAKEDTAITLYRHTFNVPKDHSAFSKGVWADWLNSSPMTVRRHFLQTMKTIRSSIADWRIIPTSGGTKTTLVYISNIADIINGTATYTKAPPIIKAPIIKRNPVTTQEINDMQSFIKHLLGFVPPGATQQRERALIGHMIRNAKGLKQGIRMPYPDDWKRNMIEFAKWYEKAYAKEYRARTMETFWHHFVIWRQYWPTYNKEQDKLN